jgi:hypothetical protein
MAESMTFGGMEMAAEIKLVRVQEKGQVNSARRDQEAIGHQERRSGGR